VPTWLKIVLLVFLLFIAAMVGFGYLVFRWARQQGPQLQQQTRQTMEEAEAFGRGKDGEACIAESLARVKRCDGFICEARMKIFLSTCLGVATVPSGFCDGVPKQTEILNSTRWTMRECARRGYANSQRCGRLLATQQEYCSRE
jgi:hypothetical protein